MLFANQDYKESPARSRRKVQTHCHLRGNLFCLGEERPPIKDTKSLADISAGLRGKHEKQSPDRTGPKGCPSRKLSSSFSSNKELAGGQARPLQHSPAARKHSSSLKPKYFGPPSPGVGHGKWEETLQVRGRLEARAGKLERQGSPWTPIYSPIGC